MKVAIVTGASRGIGHAIAESLSKSGYGVVGISRNIEPGEPFAMTIRADISDIESHLSVLGEVKLKFGRIDLLVNNAGVAPLKRVDILDAGTGSFDRLMNINLRGPFFFTQMVVNEMLKREEREDRKGREEGKRGTVIFITSVSAVASSPERAEYCISKAGLSMAAQVFADRLATTGISVFEIRPGVIYTDMTAGVKEKYDKKIAEGLIPEGRWGQPEDIAKAVVALASGEIPYATGTVIELSGGMNIRHL
ncbi:MAG: 3-ketoacyl-ACP reductase [Bacteroidales bacterium]|jgi:NAD(P)-dependent dehydrogenase (short-subunit alcohol dehydrogenase family)